MPDGSKFYVADMMADGVWIVDGNAMTVIGKIATGVGAHGIYPSRDGTKMYVSQSWPPHGRREPASRAPARARCRWSTRRPTRC